jgi:hypothetical protein
MQRIVASAAVLQIEFLPQHLQDVADVSVADFMALISPYFLSMVIPSKAKVLEREQFVPALEEMFQRNEADAGLLFFKVPADQIHFRVIQTPAESVNAG